MALDPETVRIRVSKGEKHFDLGVAITPEVLAEATPQQLSKWGKAVGEAYTKLLERFKEGTL